MSNSTDENLVARARAGDQEAYAVLVKHHYKRVFLTCLGVVGQAADAEDVAQEVFLKGWTAIRRLRDGSQFIPWIMRISRNHSINLLRKKGCIQRSMDKIAVQPSLGHEATHRVDLESALKQLSPDLREPLVLYYLDGQDAKKVAHRLNVSASNVYHRLRIATRRLHALLVEQGDDL